MSVHVSSLVWKGPLAGNEKLVLLKLADCADDEGGNTYPSVARVAKECGVSRRTVQTILKRFVSRGLLIVEAYATGGRGKPTHYRIDLERVQHDCTVSHETKGAEIAPYHETKGATGAQKGADNDAKGCKSSAPEPSVTIIEPLVVPPIVPPMPEPRPVENQKEASNETKRQNKKSETRIASDWEPTPRHFILGSELGFDEGRVRAEAVNYREHAEAHDRFLANWNQGFNMWLRKAPEFASRGPGPAGNRQAGPGGRGDTGVVAALRELKNRREAL